MESVQSESTVNKNRSCRVSSGTLEDFPCEALPNDARLYDDFVAVALTDVLTESRLDEKTYEDDFQLFGDSSTVIQTGITPDLSLKIPKRSLIGQVTIPRTTSHGCSSDGGKKNVYVLNDGGKKTKVNRSSIKKEKVPDTTVEVGRCRAEKSPHLDLSHLGLQVLPQGIFKEVGFISNLFLYGNKLTTLSLNLCALSNLRCLMLQQNWITCSGIPNEIVKLTKLQVLDLRHNRLEGHLPDSIYNLIKLEQLILSFNKITALSDALRNLQRLTILIINRNIIRSCIPESIGQLTNLCKLDLSYNQIEFLPSSLGNCVSLRDLNLQHNQLTYLPDSIGNLVNLTRLTLKYNHLVAIPESLANCTLLDEFSVENNQLLQLPSGLLSHFKSARNITLSRNIFTVFPTGDPEDIGNAMTLNMDHNKINAIPRGILGLADQLTKLNLRDNEIETLIPDDLCTWSKLTEIDLGSNRISSLPSEIEALTALEVFRLGYNQLLILPEEIGSLKSLRILDLESNQLCELPVSIGWLTGLQELNVSCNRLRTFPNTIGLMQKLKLIKAGENDICELPLEIGNMSALRDLHLNDNLNLNNLPAELSLCSSLTILGLENCPLREFPQPIVVHGSAMIIYFLQQVLQLRRQQTSL